MLLSEMISSNLEKNLQNAANESPDEPRELKQPTSAFWEAILPSEGLVDVLELYVDGQLVPTGSLRLNIDRLRGTLIRVRYL